MRPLPKKIFSREVSRIPLLAMGGGYQPTLSWIGPATQTGLLRKKGGERGSDELLPRDHVKRSQRGVHQAGGPIRSDLLSSIPAGKGVEISSVSPVMSLSGSPLAVFLVSNRSCSWSCTCKDQLHEQEPPVARGIVI